MKKSALYTIALEAVVDSESLEASAKLEVIEELLERRDVVKWQEKQEEKKAQEEVNNG